MTLRDGETYLRLCSTGIEAAASWLSLLVEETIPGDEFRGLAQLLRKLHADDAGHATFRSENGVLELTFVMAKKGELHLSVRLQSPPDYLNEVRLFLNLRRDDLPGIADGFESIL